MVRILINNTFSVIQTGDGIPHEIVDQLLSYRVKNYQIIARKKGWKNWNGIKSFYTLTGDKGSLLTGLVPDVCRQFKKIGIKYTIVDYRSCPRPAFSVPKKITLNDITLYGHQRQCVVDFIKANRGIVKGATGAGKTEIAIAIFKLMNVPTLWLTHRVNLMTQTAKRFVARMPKIAEHIGFIGGGQYNPNFLTFATVQTLQAAMKKYPEETAAQLKNCQMLIVDEAHRMKSKQFFQTSSRCTNAHFRLGLTATPFMRNDAYEDMMLKGVIGDIVSEVKLEALIKMGFLAQPLFKFIEARGEILNPKIRDWRAVYEDGIVNNNHRNRSIAKIASDLKGMNKRTLVICQELNHCKNLIKEGERVDLNFPLLSGSDSVTHRERQLKQLSNGNIKGLICTNILDEGIDVKEIDAVINAAGMQSAPTLLQRTGRAARKKEKNNYCVIIDFIDRQHPLLLEHSMKRYNHINDQPGFKIM